MGSKGRDEGCTRNKNTAGEIEVAEGVRRRGELTIHGHLRDRTTTAVKAKMSAVLCGGLEPRSEAWPFDVNPPKSRRDLKLRPLVLQNNAFQLRSHDDGLFVSL